MLLTPKTAGATHCTKYLCTLVSLRKSHAGFNTARITSPSKVFYPMIPIRKLQTRTTQSVITTLVLLLSSQLATAKPQSLRRFVDLYGLWCTTRLPPTFAFSVFYGVRSTNRRWGGATCTWGSRLRLTARWAWAKQDLGSGPGPGQLYSMPFST